MTDRFHSLTVALEVDMRDDAAAALIAAIRQLRGVSDVTGNVVEMQDHLARQRVRHEWGPKLLQIVYPGWEDKA